MLWGNIDTRLYQYRRAILSQIFPSTEGQYFRKITQYRKAVLSQSYPNIARKFYGDFILILRGNIVALLLNIAGQYYPNIVRQYWLNIIHNQGTILINTAREYYPNIVGILPNIPVTNDELKKIEKVNFS